MRYTILLSLLLLVGFVTGQRTITLEDIWQDYTFTPAQVGGFNFMLDGQHYTRLEGGRVVRYAMRTGEQVDELLDGSTLDKSGGWSGQLEDYSFSDDESKFILTTDNESIYRHSSQGFAYVYDRKTKALAPVFPEGKHRLATLDPQGKRVAMVYNNNLYFRDLATGQLTAITEDGLPNAIINGATDWVYEEEFGFDRGFYWSPDGQQIAFYRFDERAVPEFTFENYRDNLYPEYVTFKYPKVGERNSTVSIHIYDLRTGQTRRLLTVNDGESEWEYLPRIKWLPSQQQLCVFRMNRHQNDLELLVFDTVTGTSRSLLREQSKYYIDIHDNLTFLPDGRHFLWTSERDGWNHLYLYSTDGKLDRQLTQGNWEVTNVYGLDRKENVVYYQAARRSPTQREVYALPLNGRAERTLAGEPGWNDAVFSSTFDYFSHTFSTINTPPVYTVRDRNGQAVRTVENNSKLTQITKDYNTQPVEFFTFTTSEEVALNGYLIKPQGLVAGQRYPLLMFVYGGPGSQQVVDNWRGQNYWWFQMLAQQGFAVACVDNRGTGARGEEFKKMTYLQLGKYETLDQIEAAKYLGQLDFVDEQRIGIFGWSYGGYMSSLAILKGNEVFKAAIAVAPVTSWKWYDSIYTERYMRTLRENESGYRDNSPVYFADRLRGNYLLVHGLGDDNVHFQHTAEMANALVMANKQFDTYFYPNRNHGISGGPTRLHLYTKMTNFLRDKLQLTERNRAQRNELKVVPIEGGKRD